jgi:predicted membrane chloride channel (bestrophin family)
VLNIPQAERYSTKDWLHNLATIPSSRLLKRIKGVVFFNFVWSCLVYVVHKYTNFQSPGSRCHSLLGSALGLLLVFRTNAAYARFWEGRRIWEKLLSSLRDMGRMGAVYGDVLGSERVTRLMHLLCALPMVLQEHVQGFRHTMELDQYLTKADLSAMSNVTNRPYFVVCKIADEVDYTPSTPPGVSHVTSLRSHPFFSHVHGCGV